MTVIAVGIEDHPQNYRGSAPWVSDWILFGQPTFPKAMTAVSSVIFSFSGTPYFFNIMSEMEEPKLYTRAMLCCQSVVFTTYFVVGAVVYYFCGSYTTSPALGSTTQTMAKVGYGVALPGLIVTGMIVHHMPAKDICLMMLRHDSRKHHIIEKTRIFHVHWYSSVASVTLVAYIIASAIPEFNALISLIGALFGTLLVLPPYGAMYLYRHSDRGRAAAAKSQRIQLAELPVQPSPMVYRLGTAWAVLIIVLGIYCTITGTWGSLLGIKRAYKNSTGGGLAWSCANSA